jgi:hypothetical protein
MSSLAVQFIPAHFIPANPKFVYSPIYLTGERCLGPGEGTKIKLRPVHYNFIKSVILNRGIHAEKRFKRVGRVWWLTAAQSRSEAEFMN